MSEAAAQLRGRPGLAIVVGILVGLFAALASGAIAVASCFDDASGCDGGTCVVCFLFAILGLPVGVIVGLATGILTYVFSKRPPDDETAGA